MRVSCSKCGQMFESLNIDRQKALVELETYTSNHIKFHHKEVFEKVAVAVQACVIALSRIMHFSECVIVPEQEQFVQDILTDNQKLVMLALGFEESNESEDESEDEEEIIDAAPEEETSLETNTKS